MTVKQPTNIRIGGASWTMLAGQIVPAPVLRYWEKTNRISRLIAQGAIYDEAKRSAPRKYQKKTSAAEKEQPEEERAE